MYGWSRSCPVGKNSNLGPDRVEYQTQFGPRLTGSWFGPVLSRPNWPVQLVFPV